MGITSALLGAAGLTGVGAPHMMAGIHAAGDALIGSKFANKIKKSQQKSEFDTKMQMADKYGIHPLQAIGSSGIQMGGGGLNAAQMVMNEKASRKLANATQQAQDRQFDMELEKMGYATYLNMVAGDYQFKREQAQDSTNTAAEDLSKLDQYLEVTPTLKHYGKKFGGLLKDLLPDGGYTAGKTLTKRGFR